MILTALAFIAVSTFVLGWLVIIADFVSGGRLIDRIPKRVGDAFGAAHNWAWIGLMIVGASGLIWQVATQ